MRRRRRPARGVTAREPRTVRALLDFGASGARAALARVTPDHVEILGVGEVTGRSGMARPGQVMHRDRIAQLAERALSMAEWASARDGELPFIADEVVVGLTGPLLEAHSCIQHLQRQEAAAPVFEQELHDALAAVQAQHLAGLAAQQGRIRRVLVAAQLVGVMSVREATLEAHRLPDLTRGVPGKAGEYLSFALCNLTWPAKGVEILERVLEDLELQLLSATPIAQAVAAALPRPDAILLDVGREHTEIALVERGALSSLASMSRGGDFFSEALTRELHLSEKHAEVVKRRLEREPGSNRPVERVLGEAARVWGQEVERVLLALAGEAPLPPFFYVYGGGGQLPHLLEQVRSFPWQRRLPFARPPVVERLVPQHLRGLHDPRGLLHSSSHTGLAALAAWAGRNPGSLQRHLEAVTLRLAPRYRLA